MTANSILVDSGRSVPYKTTHRIVGRTSLHLTCIWESVYPSYMEEYLAMGMLPSACIHSLSSIKITSSKLCRFGFTVHSEWTKHIDVSVNGLFVYVVQRWTGELSVKDVTK